MSIRPIDCHLCLQLFFYTKYGRPSLQVNSVYDLSSLMKARDSNTFDILVLETFISSSRLSSSSTRGNTLPSVPSPSHSSIAKYLVSYLTNLLTGVLGQMAQIVGHREHQCPQPPPRQQWLGVQMDGQVNSWVDRIETDSGPTQPFCTRS